MPRLKRLSATDVVSVLQQFGFFILSQRGSHIKLRRISPAGANETLTVPNHRQLDTGKSDELHVQEAKPPRPGERAKIQAHAEQESPSADPAQWERKHEAAKERIRGHAESLDFTVTLEESVLEGQGRADVVLRRGRLTIACEISVTTTVEHEVGNVTKCIKAGFRHVALICLSRKKAGQIQEAVAAALTPEEAGRVGYYLIDEFMSKLDDRAAEDPDAAKLEQGKPRKRKFNLNAAELSESERAERENEMLKRIAEEMKRRKPRDG